MRVNSWSLFVLVLAGSLCICAGSIARGQGSFFVRGDVDQDGVVLINDPIALLTSLFGGPAPPLPCEDAGDANDDELLDLGDPVYLLAFLFAGGAAPPDPYPYCGTDWDVYLYCSQATPSCVPPQYTYVLNSTSGAGGAQDTILEIAVDHLGVTVTPFLAGDAQYDGLKFIAVGSASEVFAVQENDALGVHRVLQLSGPNTIQSEHSTYPGNAQALVVSGQDYVHLVTTSSSPPSTWVLRYLHWDLWSETVLWQTDEEYEIAGASISNTGAFVFTGSGSAGSGAFLLDGLGGVELIYETPDPGSVQFVMDRGLFWMVSTPSGSDGVLAAFDVSGGSLEGPLPFGPDPVIGDLGVRNYSTLVLPLTEMNEIVEFDTKFLSFEFTTAFDASVGLDQPIDATAPFTFAIP